MYDIKYVLFSSLVYNLPFVKSNGLQLYLLKEKQRHLKRWLFKELIKLQQYVLVLRALARKQFNFHNVQVNYFSFIKLISKLLKSQASCCCNSFPSISMIHDLTKDGQSQDVTQKRVFLFSLSLSLSLDFKEETNEEKQVGQLFEISILVGHGTFVCSMNHRSQ